MISQKYFYSIVFVVAALCVLLSHSSPVHSKDSTTNREGRFYGYGGANAMASASAGAGGFGYPGGFGLGGSSAFANANAGAGNFMYGK